MIDYELKGKRAIVTGGASGIGLEVAKVFVRSGASVAIWDINGEAVEKVMAELKKTGATVCGVTANVADAASVKAGIEKTVAELGGVDIGVNNAGIGGVSAKSGDYPVDEWLKVIGINLTGVFICQQEQIKTMRQQGTGGSIINMASILGQVGFEGSCAYVAAKHGVVGLTKSAALEHAGDKIRINSVGPGFIRTPLVESALDSDTLNILASMHALGRLGNPEEVAELVGWLASDSSSFVTGGYYAIDGGYLAR